MNSDQAEPQRLPSRTLGELALARLGKTPRKSDYRNEGALKIIKFRDILENGEIDWDNAEKGFLADEPSALAGMREVRVGDVLVTASAHMSEHIGKKTAIVQSIPPRFREAFVVGEVLQIRTKPSVDPRWVLNYMRSRDGYKAIQEKVHGVHLIASRAREIEIPVAGLDHQRRIVAEVDKQFSRLDEAVANLKHVKANLDRYVAATLGEALSGKWTGTEADWRPVPLREVADVQLGQQRAPVHAADLNPIPYIRAANVTWRGLSLGDVKSMGFPNAARYRLAYGDILLAEASGSANEVGKPAIWRDEIPGACYQKTLVRVRCQPNRLNYEFAYYFFLHTCLSGQFARLAPGVGILHLTAERMLVWPTTAPPLPVQASVVSEIERRLSIVRGVEAEVDANLKRAGALRQAVLARAYQTSPAMESCQ